MCEVLTQPLVDDAKIFTQEESQKIIRKLIELKQQKRIYLVVMTVQSLDGEAIEERAVKEFERYQIGEKDKDNGLLFIFSPHDHKMRLEVGYGLEGDISDAIAKRLLDEEIRPVFRSNNFAAGVERLIDLLINPQLVTEEFKAEAKQKRPFIWALFPVPFWLFFQIFFLLMKPTDKKSLTVYRRWLWGFNLTLLVGLIVAAANHSNEDFFIGAIGLTTFVVVIIGFATALFLMPDSPRGNGKTQGRRRSNKKRGVYASSGSTTSYSSADDNDSSSSSSSSDSSSDSDSSSGGGSSGGGGASSDW